ncbi:hypothetical protein C0992_004958 [Termitomyces sp. T32_za158]|nr:hypothetical protein C0992_004958 [Termitomyces sp. T32_za158]
MRVARNLASSFVPTNPRLAFSRAMSSEVESDKLVAASTENSNADPQIQLMKFHQATKQDSKNLKKLAESASSKANDVAFQRKCIAQLNAFHSNVLRQQTALSAIVNENHKTINDRSDHDSDHALEELLKGVIMACKDGMKYSEELVKNVPILGPYLAPT